MMDYNTLKPTQKKAIANAFGRAAKTYDRTALLQKEVGHRLLERLEFFESTPDTILDLGSGTGYFTEQLTQRYRQSECIALDISKEMLEVSRQRSNNFQSLDNLHHSNALRNYHLCADAEFLPLRDQSVDLVFSNCAIQWCTNYQLLFQGIHRILKNKGLLLFSTFGPDTLIELRECFKKIDDRPHVNHFQDMHLLGDALVRANFQAPVVDREIITVTYKNVRDLLKDLKATGANYVVEKEDEKENKENEEIEAKKICSRGLQTAPLFKQLFSAYEEFRREDIYPATFEIIYGYALKPHDT